MAHSYCHPFGYTLLPCVPNQRWLWDIFDLEKLGDLFPDALPNYAIANFGVTWPFQTDV